MTAWLALLSMLLIYIGPLLSQSQLQRSPSGLPAPASHAHPSSDHDHLAYNHKQGQSPAALPPEHPLPTGDHSAHNACGYCVLLSKLPPIEPTGYSFLAVTQEGSCSSAGRPVSVSQKAPCFPNAPARAPPSMV